MLILTKQAFADANRIFKNPVAGGGIFRFF